MESLVSLCKELYEILPPEGVDGPITYHLNNDSQLKSLVHRLDQSLQSCGAVYSPPSGDSDRIQVDQVLKVVCWNIERGKHFSEILRTLQDHPSLKEADFYLFTEVDWGMARSDNRNVTAELGEKLGMYAYFAPSYFNFTKGHGVERHFDGKNHLGLHGKSILSRWPLKNLRTVPMPNITDKLGSKEARLGQKRALLGDLEVGDQFFSLACVHLDAFSSPRTRAYQLRGVVKSLSQSPQALMAGDWNTNTLNSISTSRLMLHLFYQLVFFRPTRMVQHHFRYPETYFDRPLFQMLRDFGFDFESCNELGKGTFHLLTNDKELGEMANDQFPRWSLRYINRLIEKAGGNISMKLDWFAQKNLKCYEKKVIMLKQPQVLAEGNRASDHFPILLKFQV